MNVKISVEENKLYVEVSANVMGKSNPAGKKSWRTSDVLNYLKENHPQHKVKSVLQDARRVTNHDAGTTKGIWIFELALKNEKKEKTKQSVKKAHNAPVNKAHVNKASSKIIMPQKKNR